jgi:hypothetical protein
MCSQVQASQNHGPLSNAQAADLVRNIITASAAAAASGAANADDNGKATQTDCPLRPRHTRSHEPYVAWRPDNSIAVVPTTKKHAAVTTTAAATPLTPLLNPPKHLREQACAAHPDFCDTLYSVDETHRIAQLLYDHQNPRDCSTSNFLVLTREWHSGLGSNIHVKAWMLLVAIMTKRVLIDSPKIAWNMTNPANCPQQDWTCYFAPVSKCALPQDWDDDDEAPEFAAIDLTTEQAPSPPGPTKPGRKYVRAIAHPQPLNGALVMGQQQSVDRIKNFGGSTAFNGKPNSWWMTHATMYLIRPNNRTLDVTCWYWSCMPNRGFGLLSRHHHQQQQQQPSASIFVRSGDKWKEAHLRTAQEHFDALKAFVRANPTLRPGSVYFGTDDALVLSDVARRYSADYNLTWIGYHRDVKGLSFEETITRAFSPKIEWQVLVSLADLYISSLADIFVGTLSSNWCRLVDELRKVHGKAGIPYLTPSGEALVAGV